MRHFAKRTLAGSAIVGCLLLGFCATAPNQINLDEYSTLEATLCGPSCGKLILDLVF